MYLVGILLCIVTVGLQTVTGDFIPKALQIHCNFNARNATMVDIIIDTALPTSSYICDEGSMCTGGIVQPGASNSSAPTLKSCQKDKPITIVVANSSNNGICGGDGTVYFELYCLSGNNIAGIVGPAIQFTVQRKGDLGKQATQSPKKEFDLLNLTMEFYKGSSQLHAPAIVTIGDIVDVLISGPDGAGLQVRNCTAYSPGKSMKIELLDISGGYSAENKGGELLEKFKMNCDSIHNYTSKKCFYAHLHAFHFKDSLEVSLECSINVCSDAKDCATTGGRRRRSTNLQKHVLRKSLFVYDELHATDVQERSNVRAIGGSLMLTTLGVLLAFAGFI